MLKMGEPKLSTARSQLHLPSARSPSGPLCPDSSSPAPTESISIQLIHVRADLQFPLFWFVAQLLVMKVFFVKLIV